jgi:acyl phosphate:glycerol-3-phosphate acyltransferase
MIPLAVLAIAYLLGAIPFGYLLVKWKTGSDIRTAGSGNIGATNVLRTTGRSAGILTLILDIGKGYAAVWVAGRLTAEDPFWMSAAALAVIAGHAFPVFLGFHGGKAVASFVGAFMYLAPWALLAETLIFVVVAIETRQISLASIVGAATFPLAVFLIARAPWPLVIAALLAGAFIIYRHRNNILRIRLGSESVFKF